MGTQFFWFYDLLIVGIVLGITFRCYKKGFVSVVVGFVAILAAFAFAAFLSEPVANLIYDNVLDEKINEYINSGIEDFGDENILYELSKANTEKVKINGVAIKDIDLTPDSAGKITLDISNLDLSETGLPNMDLSVFGINAAATDFTKINAGKVNITPDELKETGLGTLVVSKALAEAMQNETSYGSLVGMFENVSDSLPFLASDINLNDSIAKIIAVVIDADSADITGTMVNGLVRPMVMPLLNAVVFFVIFLIVSILLSIIARALKLVNRVPVIGKVNSLFGAIVGVCEGLIVVAVVSVIINIIVALTGNNIVLLNTMTIDETIIFKHIFYSDLLNIKL